MSMVTYEELVVFAKMISEQTPKKAVVNPALKPGQVFEQDEADTIIVNGRKHSYTSAGSDYLSQSPRGLRTEKPIIDYSREMPEAEAQDLMKSGKAAKRDYEDMGGAKARFRGRKYKAL